MFVKIVCMNVHTAYTAYVNICVYCMYVYTLNKLILYLPVHWWSLVLRILFNACFVSTRAALCEPASITAGR